MNYIVNTPVLRACLLLIPICAGCQSAQRLSMQASSYQLDVKLDPSEHWLEASAEIELIRDQHSTVDNSKQAMIELLLHPELEIQSVRAIGGEVVQELGSRKSQDGDLAPTRHRFLLDRPVDQMTLNVDFHGTLFQDATEGEVAGQIHNFKMRAHIGTDGVYLAGANWYPQPFTDDHAEPRLAQFTLRTNRPEGIELVAGAEAVPSLTEESSEWRSPYPLQGMVLVGGPHEVHRSEHHGTKIALHLKPEQSAHVDGLFEAVKRNLDRYEPLIGDYPAGEFRIVDNFFSSGFAFPAFTLLSSAVIDMGKRSQTAHGYIDHEMLHCWWGNGVHVDPRDGNWCEALASYGANYYGYVLDGKHDEARRKRRNYCHFLSRIEPDRDKPLGTYGQENGCGRGIAYSKGAAVFHMLAQTMGQDRFFEAMRQLTRERVGRFASWDDIRSICEDVHGASLKTFFDQWVRRGGAPKLEIESARFDSAEQTLALYVSQGEPAFELTVPVRITHVDGSIDIDVSFDQPHQLVNVPVDVIPLTVEADPDYHVFRRVEKGDRIPTTATTRQGDALVSVVPAGEVAESYAKLRRDFAKSFKDKDVVSLAQDDLGTKGEELRRGSVLILGEAVRDESLAPFLQETDLPITWTSDGFVFDGVTYDGDGDAVLCTARHPRVSGCGVTVVFANTEAAIPRPMLIPFYEHSMVIFRDGRPIVRHDLERSRIVDVDRS